MFSPEPSIDELYEMEIIDARSVFAWHKTLDRDVLSNVIQASGKLLNLYMERPCPGSRPEHIAHLLKLFSAAYCSDRLAELQSWLAKHELLLDLPPAPNTAWEDYVQHCLLDSWSILFRKGDLSGVDEIYVGMARWQQAGEEAMYAKAEANVRHVALNIEALYHAVKATCLLASYLQNKTPDSIHAQIDSHFAIACKIASSVRNSPYGMQLEWLYVASRIIVDREKW